MCAGSQVGHDIPQEVEYPCFFGTEINTCHRCFHGHMPERKVAFDMAATGRRFIGCPLKGRQRCRFVIWIDKPTWRITNGFRDVLLSLRPSPIRHIPDSWSGDPHTLVFPFFDGRIPSRLYHGWASIESERTYRASPLYPQTRSRL